MLGNAFNLQAWIDEHRHLRLPHRERGAVLDFVARHREAPGERAVALLGPLDDVDELLLDEIHQGHVCLHERWMGGLADTIPAES